MSKHLLALEGLTSASVPKLPRTVSATVVRMQFWFSGRERRETYTVAQ